MPRSEIVKWNEKRMIRILLMILSVYIVFCVTFMKLLPGTQALASSYYVAGLFNLQTGQFHSQEESEALNSQACFFVQIYSMSQYICLLWALHAQLKIDAEYNISLEILFVTIVWTLCNQGLAATWSLHYHWMQWRFWDDEAEEALTLNETRWYAYFYLFTRSLLCIFISTLNNIYQSYHTD